VAQRPRARLRVNVFTPGPAYFIAEVAYFIAEVCAPGQYQAEKPGKQNRPCRVRAVGRLSRGKRESQGREETLNLQRPRAGNGPWQRRAKSLPDDAPARPFPGGGLRVRRFWFTRIGFPASRRSDAVA
jgi:hypothetical protein